MKTQINRNFMKQSNNLVFIIIIFLLIFEQINSIAQEKDINDSINEKSSQFRIGLSATGWESPYGQGIDIGIIHKNKTELIIGYGNVAEKKYKLGIGIRYIILPVKKWSPFISAHYFHSFGINAIELHVDDGVGVYKIKPNNGFVLNLGLRYAIHDLVYLHTGFGYSFAFNKDKAVYLAGDQTDELQKFADEKVDGGVSITFGIVVKIPRKIMEYFK